jgi:16S rRNA (guanine(966)-N(2))-methyltransferase RsmD
MRIIGGTHRGRVIKAPNNLPVRPTTDFAKESLFNILNNEIDFEECDVLDLFCGTGNITYEFASRGCKHITTIDVNTKCTSFVKESVKSFGFENVVVMTANVFLFAQQCKRKFDVIFADPPFADEKIKTIPDIIFENDLLNEDGLLIVEHPPEVSFSAHPNFSKHKVYGHVNFSFFRKK